MSRSFAEYWSTGEDCDAIRILVVDDDENMVELLVGVLGAFGYVVSGATTVQAASWARPASVVGGGSSGLDVAVFCSLAVEEVVKELL